MNDDRTPPEPGYRGGGPAGGRRAARHYQAGDEFRAADGRSAADGRRDAGGPARGPRPGSRAARRADAWTHIGDEGPTGAQPRYGAATGGRPPRHAAPSYGAGSDGASTHGLGGRYDPVGTGPYGADPYGAGPHQGDPRRGDIYPPPGYQPRGGRPYPPPDGRYDLGYSGGRPPIPPRTGGGGPGSGDGGRRRRRGGVIFGRIVASIVSVVLIVVSGIAWAAVGGTPHNPSDATDAAGSVGVTSTMTTTTDAKGNVVTVPVTTHGMNILVVGSDARTDAEGNPLSPAELKAVSTQLDGGGVSTDTIMIVHVPGDGSRATAISIPRDTWIDDSIAGAPGVVGPYSDGTQGPYKPNKINSYYGTAMTYEREYLVSQGVSDEAELQRRSAEAGRTMLIKVLQQLTGMKIDHYAEVNLIGFYLLSQAIGGVPVCLVKAVKDRQSGADFPAGHFEVSGSAAMSFVRQRHGLPGGDLDRIRRQQAFLASAANEILSLGTLTSPSKLKALIDAADRSLVLDKGFDLLSFAQQMINLASGNITFTTVPTHGNEMMDGKSAVKVDDAEVRGFFANLMTDHSTTTAAPSRTAVNRAATIVDVQNGTETPGMAAQAGAVVAAAGFQRGQLSDYPGVTPDHQQTATTIHYPAGGEAAAKLVAATLKIGKTVEDDSIAAGHLLVVVGTDMPVIPADQLPSVTTPTAPTSSTAPTSGLSTTMPSDAINASHVPCIN